MSLENIKAAIGDHGKDIRLNLSNVISEDGAPGLSSKQIWGTALACAYQTKNPQLIEAVLAQASAVLDETEKQSARAAATIMAMNNIYYRFTHMAQDKEFSKMPAKLRMTVIGNPGIPKADFELYCLAVSALNGCEACVNSHIIEVKKGGITNEGVHSSVRIASVISAAAQALI